MVAAITMFTYPIGVDERIIMQRIDGRYQVIHEITGQAPYFVGSYPSPDGYIPALNRATQYGDMVKRERKGQ